MANLSQRVGRLGILIWRNCGKRRTTATVEALPGSVARVDVEVSRAWKFRPGQYMYLYLPCLGLWTSHPFTVAWPSSRSDFFDSREKRSSSGSFSSIIGGPEKTTLSVLIKGQDGFTKKLLRKVEDSPDGRIKATAFAEGPFGMKYVCSISDVIIANNGSQVGFILLPHMERSFWSQVASVLPTQCPTCTR